MVVKEDGTKWACQSCLKGHRVSGCTHTDRELFFVPKKGRPVTQCQHCRSERKKRSAHVKCDCGDKNHHKEKCIHLRDADASANSTAVGGECQGHHDLVPLLEESSPEAHICCCSHGGKCNCATVKKENGEDDVESVPKKPQPRPKPRLTTHQSDGHLTQFSNGHHKPCHRNNNTAHESGAPYKLPRSQSHAVQGVSAAARRSVDSLATVQKSSRPASWQSHNSAGSIRLQRERRPSQPENGSPQAATVAFNAITPDMQTTPDLRSSSFNTPEQSSSVPTSMHQDFGFPSTQSAYSVATSATGASVPTFSNLPTSTRDFGNAMSDYWGNFDWNNVGMSTFDAQPALTNASSGTLSEVDDLPPVDDFAVRDNQFPASGVQRQPSQYNIANSFTNDGNLANSSNRWSMPVLSQQTGDTSGLQKAYIPLTAYTKPSSPVEMISQPMPVNDFSGFQFRTDNINNNMMADPSQQAPEMQAAYDFSSKIEQPADFDWASLMPQYTNNTMTGDDNNNMQYGYALSSAANPSVAASATSDYQDNCAFDGNFGFDNSAMMPQWDDGTYMSNNQDYMNMSNFEQDYRMPSNSNPWTS